MPDIWKYCEVAFTPWGEPLPCPTRRQATAPLTDKRAYVADLAPSLLYLIEGAREETIGMLWILKGSAALPFS